MALVDSYDLTDPVTSRRSQRMASAERSNVPPRRCPRWSNSTGGSTPVGSDPGPAVSLGLAAPAWSLLRLLPVRGTSG